MWKSLKNFVIINAAVSILGCVKTYLYNFDFKMYVLFEIASTVVMVDYMSKINKPDIKNRAPEKISNSTEHNDTSSHYLALVTRGTEIAKIAGITTIKCITHSFVINQLISSSHNAITNNLAHTIYDLPFSMVIFIAQSFMFEVFFDFAHYGVHKFLHSNATLYQLIHKTHHEYKNPTAWTAFHIHPIDLVMSYSFPLVFATLMITPSKLTFLLFTTYLTHQEIGGHLGKKMYPTSSFMQFVWLPRILHIQLYTEDHDYHHKFINCNYGKRFALFDKMFGTYRSGIYDTRVKLEEDKYLELVAK